MNSSEYEKLTQEIYQTLLLAEDGITTSDVKHNIELEGRSGQKHQIDVYWEFEIAGTKYRTAIECKNYSSSVSIGKIRDFYGVLSDIGNINGIFVTTVNFHSGAIKFAEHYGINIVIIRPPTDEDWKGRMRDIQLVINMLSNKNIQRKFIVDDEWMKEKYSTKMESIITGSSNEIFIIRQDGSVINSLYDFDCKLTDSTSKSITGVCKFFKFDEDAFIVDNNGRWIKLKSIEYTYDVQVSTHKSLIKDDKIAKAIMIDVISGKMKFFDHMGGVREREPLPPNWEDEFKRLTK